MKFTILALAALANPSVKVVTAARTKQTAVCRGCDPTGSDGEGVTPIHIIPDDASLCGSNIP